MRYVYLLIFLISVASCTPRKAETKISRIGSVSNQVSNQFVTSFLEDNLGYIWIGTNKGLNKYNGNDFHQYFYNRNDSLGLPGDKIQGLFKDSKNHIWVATDHGIAKSDNNGAFTAIEIIGSRKSALQFAESKDGRIFANMQDDVFQYDTKSGTFKKILSFDSYNISNRFFIDSHDRLWLINRNSIVCYTGSTKEIFRRFVIPDPINLYYASYLKNGQLWIKHGKNHLTIIDTYSGSLMGIPPLIKDHPVLSRAPFTLIRQFEENKILINTHKNGLFLYDPAAGKIIHHTDPAFPFSIPKNEITSIFTDSNKNLWIGTHDQSFSVVYKYRQQFNNNNQLRKLINEKSVTSIATDGNNNMWISTYMDELYVYNSKSNNVTRTDLKTFFTEDPYFQDKITATYVDRDKNIWLITNAKAVRCRLINNKLQREKTYQLNNILTGINEDPYGTIWISGVNENVYTIPKGADNFTTIPVFRKGNGYHSIILKLSNGTLFAAASFQNPKIITPGTKQIDSIFVLGHHALEEFIPTCAFEDSAKNIWIGIAGRDVLIYDQKTGKVRTLANTNNVMSIKEDIKGNIWMGTLTGLSKFDCKTKRLFSYYDYDGTGNNQYNSNSVCQLADGSLVFGGTHGLTMFNPAQITVSRRIPVYFEDLKVYGHRTMPGAGIIDSSLVKKPKITLKHDQNSISISYAALDYSEYPRVRYYYKLRGYDKYWIDARNNREANYSNLRPGDYTFTVKITSNDNSVIEAENAIAVHISRSPWLSTAAIFVYLLLILALAAYVKKLYEKIRFNKNMATVAIFEKEREALVNEVNMSFFSNISHEFRTPLTMIAGPVSTLMGKNDIEGENRHLLGFVDRNIKRMLRLINQLMDLNKLESDSLKLNVRRVDIINEIQCIIALFDVHANEKGITLKTYGLEDSFFMHLDQDQLDKILGNLISNALKFTPKGGTITIKFDVIQREQAVKSYPSLMTQQSTLFAIIKVEDTGQGIPEEQLEQIFLKYYQVKNGSDGHYNWGTGIGLYFAKLLARLHHGDIIAANSVNGGSIFTIVLPADSISYPAAEQENTLQINQADLLTVTPIDETKEKALLPGHTHQETILIADDDSEISFYLKSILSPYYKVVNKYDGESAYRSLEETFPALVISDVLMPGINGYALCTMIKENLSYCHIPVVLLTAKSSLSEKIKGLDVGANAYVTKPFEPSYLLAVIKSQLKNKEYARNILTSNTDTATIDEDILSPQDKNFMNNVYELMERELANPDWNINAMTEVMKMSRTKFYYKLKALTGENPNAFFRKYKLNIAARLILEGHYNISEIANMTGFTNLSHFSVSFKKQFQKNPSEYGHD